MNKIENDNINPITTKQNQEATTQRNDSKAKELIVEKENIDPTTFVFYIYRP